MPVHCPLAIRPLNPDEFAQLDYRIMGHAYACQNDLGRFCEESVYEADLKVRLLAGGFREVHTQVPVTVTHRDFTKTYFLDLVADDALYELKTAVAFTGEHEAQMLHYLFLRDVRRGKLLNFRPAKVQGRIVATGLSVDDRRRFQARTSRWREVSPACATLRETLLAILADWGAFLDIALYQEALIHFLGSEARVTQRLPLVRAGHPLGTQRFLVRGPGVAFRITAFTQKPAEQERHLRRLLSLTGLNTLQWINLNHSEIEFTTLMSEE